MSYYLFCHLCHWTDEGNRCRFLAFPGGGIRHRPVRGNDDCVVLPCSTEDLYISRAVTPNGDGQNDTFEVGGLDLCDFTFDVKIFNRWGHMVFESGDYQNNWDGYNYGGGMTIGSATELPSGTYYYVLNIIDSGYKPMTGYIYLGTN